MTDIGTYRVKSDEISEFILKGLTNFVKVCGSYYPLTADVLHISDEMVLA